MKTKLYNLAKKLNLDIEGVEIVVSDKFTWRGAVGGFYMTEPDKIYICSDQTNEELLIPVIAHELKHREQFKRMGFLVYLILSNPLWRWTTIENEAYAEQERVRMEVENVL